MAGKRGHGVPHYTRSVAKGGPLRCISCGHDNTICTDSRPRKGGRYRMRVCPECGTRFSTTETYEDNLRALPATDQFGRRHAEWYARRLATHVLPTEHQSPHVRAR